MPGEYDCKFYINGSLQHVYLEGASCGRNGRAILTTNCRLEYV